MTSTRSQRRRAADATAAPSTDGPSPLSRRGFLSGATLTAGAVAMAACAPDPIEWGRPGQIPVVRIDKVPDGPDGDNWERGAPIEVEMDAQTIALPHRTQPVVPKIKVRAIHDGRTIGFRLSWGDEDGDEDTVPCDGFRDACAVMLAPGSGDEQLRTMGATGATATLLQWKADWQRDLDEGVRGVRDSFPNVSVDVYPPLAVPPEDVQPSAYVDAGVTQWLPGMHVGNPISAQTRTTCVEKMLAQGFGSVTSATTQNATGRGEHTGDGWRVAILRPLRATDDEEIALEVGTVCTCAFALWSGSDGDSGGRKTPSKTVYRLEIRP